MILLRGTCIVDESMLTGEAVPQMKESLENLNQQDETKNFNEQSDGKLHILYGGTKIVQHSPPKKESPGKLFLFIFYVKYQKQKVLHFLRENIFQD